MVKAKLDVYYTFQIMSKPDEALLIHCKKWEEFSDMPIETYKVMPDNKTAVGGCSCPAWKWDCKHVKCCLEAKQFGYLDELWRWTWSEKGGWVRRDDIQTIEELDL